MLVECGFTRAQAPDGSEWTFRPSLGRIADLGSPQEIVRLYGELHGPRAAEAAAYVLAVLADQDDVTPLVGAVELEGDRLVRRPGAMSGAEQIVIAQHLMQHGICGTARPEQGGGEYAAEFRVAEHVAAAVAGLEVPRSEVLDMSMTELQMLYEAKFPEQAAKRREAIGEDEYRQFMARMKEMGHG